MAAQAFTNFAGGAGTNQPTSYVAANGFVGAPATPFNPNSPTFGNATFPSGVTLPAGTVIPSGAITATTLKVIGTGTGGTSITSGQTSTTSNTLALPTTTSDTLAGLGTAQTWTAAQTFTNSDFILLGSSTGATTFTSLNASATNYTLSFPAVTGTSAQTSGANLFVADLYRGTSTSLSNATPTAITGLSGAVVIGTYAFRAYLPTTANGTSGIAVSFVLTNSAALGAMNTTAMGTATGVATVVQNNSTTTSATNLFANTAAALVIMVEGTFTVTTGGTFSLFGALNTGSTACVVGAGGYMQLTRIA